MASKSTADACTQTDNIPKPMNQSIQKKEKITLEMHGTPVTEGNFANYLFKKLPNHVLFDNIFKFLSIRDIFQFGQALEVYKDCVEYQDYYAIFTKWLLSDSGRNFIYKKMTCTSVIDFLIDLQVPVLANDEILSRLEMVRSNIGAENQAGNDTPNHKNEQTKTLLNRRKIYGQYCFEKKNITSLISLISTY